MCKQSQEIVAILSRLQRVEKENRRLRQVGMSALLIACIAILMGQTHPNRIIEAQKFVVRDASGQIRGVFGMMEDDPRGPSLALGSTVDVLGQAGSKRNADKYGVVIHGGDYAWLNLRSDQSREYVNAVIASDPDSGPNVSVEDRDYYKAVFGTTDLVTVHTGKKERTSAASVVLFGKDKHVLWSAP